MSHKSLVISHKLSGLVIGFLLAGGLSVLAFTEPTLAPPGGNVAAPINVSATAQTKAGDLTVNNFFAKNFSVAPGASEYNITNVNNVTGFDDLFLKGNTNETAPVYIAGSEIKMYTASTERLTITNSGNVGIGTANPNRAKLETTGMVGNTTALFGLGTQGVSLISSWPGVAFNSYFDGAWKSISSGWTGNLSYIASVSPSNGGFVFRTGEWANGPDQVVGSKDVLQINKDGTAFFNGPAVVNNSPGSSAAFVMTASGVGGRALAGGSDGWLTINYANDFAGGTRVASSLTVDKLLWVNDSVRINGPSIDFVGTGRADFSMSSTRGDGGRALSHDWSDTLALNYAGDFSGGVRVDSKLNAQQLCINGDCKSSWPSSGGAGATPWYFVVGGNGALYYKAGVGGSWTEVPGGCCVSGVGLSAARDSGNNIHVVARGGDGQAYRKIFYSNGSWSGWDNVAGGSFPGVPSVETRN